MATVSKTYDVFISHAAADGEIAKSIAHSLESSGLSAFHSAMIPNGKTFGDDVREALSESHAIVAIISAESISNANVMLELGAASAWNKPVFLLVRDPNSVHLTGFLEKYVAYPMNRLDDVIRAIQTNVAALSDDERRVLADVYQVIGVPTDKLSDSSRLRDEFSTEFKQRTNKQISGERLLYELLRLRKGGRLPRLATAS